MSRYIMVTMGIYLDTEDEGNDAQNEETEQDVDDGENQVVVWLCLSDMSIGNCWLLSHYNLQGEREEFHSS